jgi:hypothetical protein
MDARLQSIARKRRGLARMVGCVTRKQQFGRTRGDSDAVASESRQYQSSMAAMKRSKSLYQMEWAAPGMSRTITPRAVSIRESSSDT